MTEPAYLPDPLVAYRLGRKVPWLRRHRKSLEAEGFPKKDPIVGLTLSADLDAWLEKRRRVSNPVVAPKSAHHDTTRSTGENLNAL